MTAMPGHLPSQATPAAAGGESPVARSRARTMTAPQAASIMGLSRRHVDRLCANGTLVASQRGAEWLIDPSSHPSLRLAAGYLDTPVLAAGVLGGLTAAKRAALYQRYCLVATCLAAQDERPSGWGVVHFRRRWLEGWNARNHPAISLATLKRWLASFAAGGLAGLIDGRKGGDRSVTSPEAWEAFRGLYLSEAQPAIPRLWEIVAASAAERGWNWPSLRTVQEMTKCRLDPKQAAFGKNPKRFRDRCLPYVERDWSQIPAMGLWVADHRQHDVLLPHRVAIVNKHTGQERYVWKWNCPWLTLFLDARSWMPVGWMIDFDSPNGNSVMSTFVAAVSEHGQPEAVYLDNGKDFRMHRFAGGRRLPPCKGETIVPEKIVRPILELLDIKAHFALPYNAKAKIVEPFFRLVAEWFDKAWETYRGNRDTNRPERVKGLDRLDGAAQQHHAAGLTIEAFRAAFDAWVKTDYSLRKSPSAAADGLSPAEAFVALRESGFQPVRPSIDALALLLMPSVPVTVRQNGVYVHAFGRHYWADELEDRRCGSGRDMGRKVLYRYRVDDDSQVFVFDARSDTFLCVATPYIGSGVHPLASSNDERAQLGEALALQRHLDKKYTKEVADLRASAAPLLEVGRLSAAKLGRLAEPSSLPRAAMAVVRLDRELDGAAAAGRSEKARRTIRQRAEDFLNATAARGATRTDDDLAVRADDQEALDLLSEGSNQPGTDGDEPPHDG